MTIAHIDSDGKIQTLTEHCRETADLCQKRAAPIGFGETGYLIGLLHDFGKATEKFQNYIKSPETAVRGSIHHAPGGAIYIYDRKYANTVNQSERITAQIISMVIYGHHSGLMDVVSPDGKQTLSDSLTQDKEKLCYEESRERFLDEVAGEDEIDALFDRAVCEVKAFIGKVNEFFKGEHKDNYTYPRFHLALLMRLLLSVLVDSDRLDTACFSYSAPLPEESGTPAWEDALSSLESKLASFPTDTPIGKIRHEISDECFDAANTEGRIFRLTVPTGGGKTFSSLRFALKRAANDIGTRRIFYVIPYNTILDQNARDIREALGDSLDILEHHSNVVFEADETEEFTQYRILTERWDADIVLTSAVQFMNALYAHGNTDARRMSALIGSVLIFDEIQALPLKCRVLFERAAEFLANLCGCTVVLCTATQPQIETTPAAKEIIGDTEKLFSSMERVHFHDESNRLMTTKDAAEGLKRLIEKYTSVLVVVNTKKAAKEICELVEKDIPTIHLSTGMYPKHRLSCIDKIKNREPSKPLLCVSTSLIEAGINISFPCVVRSLAGLGSILQAAGRCNRNGSAPFGDVYIWQLDENLSKLPEIRASAEITKGLIYNNEENLGTPDTIKLYYERERKNLPKLISQYSEKHIDNSKYMAEFPVPDVYKNVTICSLLGKQKPFDSNSLKDAYTFPLHGAYRTAAEHFCVIDSETYSVLVPEGRGKEIASLLEGGNLSYNETKMLIREAGGYCVSLYSERFHRMKNTDKAIRYLEKAGIWQLCDGWYDSKTGIRDTMGELPLLKY